MSRPATNDDSAARRQRHTLWIDGVGGFLVCLGDEIAIGGPGSSRESADVVLLANLRSRHAVIRRRHGSYRLEPLGPTKLQGRTLESEMPLSDGALLELGGSVRLRFRLPSPLSATAVLEFVSDHRPAQSLDSVILMEDNCLLGRGRSHHVDCRGWSESVVLFRRDQGFRCKSRTEMWIDGRAIDHEGAVPIGSVVTGSDFTFRLEASVGDSRSASSPEEQLP